MKKLFKTKSARTVMVLFFFAGIFFFTPSCMMMAPMHHMDYDEHHHQDGTHEHVYSDPVCGHQIDHISSELTYEYRGVPYYFHSGECMDSFKLSPRKYLRHNLCNDYGHHNQYWLWGMGGLAMGVMMALMVLL